jgi:UDP-N-acetylglucosamine 2-epimerase (non-hydrolysing)
LRAIEQTKRAGSSLQYRLIHTGQHYDDTLSGAFFRELQIPDPDFYLNVGSGSHAEQTAAVMVAYEKILRQHPRPALCVVAGDVNSTLAAALTAKKCGVPVAHIEAGLRSGDWTMPEEINRVATDSISDYYFTTTESAGHMLLQSGADPARIFFVGNTMIDTLLHHAPRFHPPLIWQTANLTPRAYLLLTLHRPANVDDPDYLKALLELLRKHTGSMPIIFPVHPRTERLLQATSLSQWSHLHFIAPLPYLEFNYLAQHACGVITDSGGVSEETTVLGVPCLTLRNNTERPETVTIGTNELAFGDLQRTAELVQKMISSQWKQGKIPPLWDGKAAERIVSTLETLLPIAI